MHILFVLLNFAPGVWQDTTTFLVSKLCITGVASFLKKCIWRHGMWGAVLRKCGVPKFGKEKTQAYQSQTCLTHICSKLWQGTTKHHLSCVLVVANLIYELSFFAP